MSSVRAAAEAAGTAAVSSQAPQPDMSPGAFGARVREIRKRRGMTQAALAATVGRGHSMMAHIESGKRQVHVDELVTFANALGVPPAALIGTDLDDHYAAGYRAGWEAARRVVLGALDGADGNPAREEAM